MSYWTYKGVPGPDQLTDPNLYSIDLRAWMQGVDAALGLHQPSGGINRLNDFYEMLLEQVGYVDGAETSADGSADNDLAHVRAQTVLKFIELVKGHSTPEDLLPKPEPVVRYARHTANGSWYKQTGDSLTYIFGSMAPRHESGHENLDQLLGIESVIEVSVSEVPTWAR